MASKQEKLAAARRKLKEFQGKFKECDNVKQYNVPDTLASVQSARNSSPMSSSVISTPSHTPTFSDLSNSECDKRYHMQKYDGGRQSHQTQYIEDNKEIIQSFDLYKKPPNSPTNWSDPTQNLTNSNKIFTGENMSALDNIKPLKSEASQIPSDSTLMETNPINFLKSASIDDKISYQSSNNKSYGESSKDKSGSISPELDNNKWNPSYPSSMFPLKENIPLCQNEPKDTSILKSSALNDVIRPLQTELQNHAQTINILVQQRNEAQNALAHAQNLLSEKLGEISQQGQQIKSLTLVINDLNMRLSESECKVRDLHSENEIKSQQMKETNSSIQALTSQIELKDKECLEIRKKYEEKSKECQNLLYSLNETQSQLSLCQIELQNQSQPMTEGNSEVMLKLDKLKNENLSLSQELDVKRRELESANMVNEQSSQNFKAYAQQCNAELQALNAKIKDLTAANEKLSAINDAMTINLTEKEVNQSQADDVSVEDCKSEIANLHEQINELTEANSELQRNCQKLQQEISMMRQNFTEKEMELENMADVLKELECENKKLLLEVDSPKANERLLAAIESDKVAAAKAVSQNQKLKSQIIELEEAFVKLSEEKLELTNQLSHEKHLNKKLQDRLKTHESHHHEDEDHHHHRCDGSHDHEDHDKEDDLEPLVNDSQEIGELKRIIRQLQDDKMELKSRLNSSVNMEMKSNGGTGERGKLGDDVENEVEEQENAKIRLQQMEEKVRKTMNEIAKLDEEKEKLEHLVLQLQGETETIGEYITLYQKQRMLLKQRSQEKDNQLIQLSKDKEELKSKLNDLDALVQHLLKEKNEGKNGTAETSPLSAVHPEETENTAVKIRALINEIGSTNLISNQSVAFKHCSCCSGRLITI